MSGLGRILIIDDNPKNIQLLGNILNDSGFEIEIALGGHEALEWVKEEMFDLILLDVMMPEINGFEVCEKIRSDKKYDNIPIIFITAKTDKSSLIRGFNSGGQDYIAKPFDSLELMARVNTQISLKKSKEELLSTNNRLEDKVTQRTQELEQSNNQLQKLHKSKDKFLSFVGKEVGKPIQELNKVVNLIKHSAESSKLLELTNLLETTVSKLQFITEMASQLTNLNEKKKFDTDELFLNNVVEHIMIDQDFLFTTNNIEITNNIDTDVAVIGNKDLIKNSLIGILEIINECSKGPIQSCFNCFIENNEISLSLEIKPCDLDLNNFRNTPENTALFLSYSELVMVFHNGRFSFESKNQQSVFNWTFPLSKK